MTLVDTLDALPPAPRSLRCRAVEVAHEGAALLGDRDALVVVEWAAQTFGERCASRRR
jgi:hypothetical protein